jgi:hypothetical protein
VDAPKKCWHCDRPLAFTKRLIGAHFCSGKHERLYLAKEATLSLQRIIGFAPENGSTQERPAPTSPVVASSGSNIAPKPQVACVPVQAVNPDAAASVPAEASTTSGAEGNANAGDAPPFAEALAPKFQVFPQAPGRPRMLAGECVSMTPGLTYPRTEAMPERVLSRCRYEMFPPLVPRNHRMRRPAPVAIDLARPVLPVLSTEVRGEIVHDPETPAKPSAVIGNKKNPAAGQPRRFSAAPEISAGEASTRARTPRGPGTRDIVVPAQVLTAEIRIILHFMPTGVMDVATEVLTTKGEWISMPNTEATTTISLARLLETMGRCVRTPSVEATATAPAAAAEEPKARKKAGPGARRAYLAPAKAKSAKKVAVAKQASKGAKKATPARGGRKTAKVLELRERPGGRYSRRASSIPMDLRVPASVSR